LTKQTANLKLSKPEMADKISTSITQLANNFDAIDATFQDHKSRVDNIVAGAGNSNTEIVDARGGKVVLKDRLDAVDASLAEKASKTYVDSEITKKASGAPKGVYATLSALQTALPTGSSDNQLVTADGKWYYWSGSAWTAGAVYQSTGIADGSITRKSTNFLQFKRTGKNLFNPNDPDIQTGYQFNDTQDGTTTANATYSITGYIRVSNGDKLIVSKQTGTFNTLRGYQMYDQNKTILSTTSATGLGTTLTVSNASAYYIRIAYGNGNTGYQIEKGTVVTAYEAYYDMYQVDEAKIELPLSTASKTDFLISKSASKNLYNPTAKGITPGSVLNADGTITANASYEITDYMPIEEFSYVAVNKTDNNGFAKIRSYVFYDQNKAVISGSGSAVASPLFAPIGAKYVRITHSPTDVQYQVELGASPTSYTPYVDAFTLDEAKIIAPKTPSVLTPLKTKTLVINGMSITAGSYPTDGTPGYEDVLTRYSTIVADAFKMAESNHAIGGSVLAIQSANPTTRDPLISRYQSMANGDIVIIDIGTNDWQYDWTPLGTMNSRNNNEFYGALHNLCLGLLEKYTGKPILFLTPIKRYQTPYNVTPLDVNANGKTLEDYGNIIKQVCGYYGIPVLDMHHECTLNPSISTQKTLYVPDGTHPNLAGHAIMARRIIGYLKQIM
jgi:lysophospholipase L1-like esterase